MKRLLTILCIPAVLLLGGPSEGYAFDKLSLQQLLTVSHCVNCDLRGANLSKADLEEADLSGANLSKANLSGANLSRANLREANLREANLWRADLSWANLTDAIFCRTKMPRGNVENRDCK